VNPNARHALLAAGLLAVAAGSALLLAALEPSRPLSPGLPALRDPASPGAGAAFPGGPGAGASGVAPLSGPSGAIEGLVRDPEGKPAPGVGVSVRGTAEGRAWTAAVRTGPGGAYSLRAPAGKAFVRAVSRVHLDSDETEVEVAAGATARADLALAARARARARVLGTGGEAVAGAAVRLSDARTGNVFEAVPGPGGALEFPPLPRGEYRVEAAAPGFAAGPATARVLSVSGPRAELDVRLHPSCRFGGLVRDEAGNALPGAEIRAFSRAGPSGRAVSGPDGAYALEVLPGRVSLVALRPDKAPAFLGDFEAAAGGWTGLDAVLERGAALRGKVTGPRGAPLPGARLRVQWIGPARGFTHLSPEASTDAEGTYRVDHVASGTLAVSVRADGFAPGARRFQAGPSGSELQADFSLGGGFTLRGRALDARREGLAGARVELPGGSGDAVSAPGGEWSIEGLPRGPVDVSVSAEGRVHAQLRGVPVPGAAPDAVLPRMGSLRGRVERAGVGQEGVEVVASSGGTLRYRTLTDASGTFAFAEIPPASYRLEARAEGFRGDGGPAEVPEGGAAPEARLELLPE
jgi:protocatechuate 3,4-dioxygenase beta subunit